MDKRLKDKITEHPTYYSIIHTSEILDDINNYVDSTMGNNKAEVCLSSITFKFDEKFDKICDSKYKKKIKKVATYVVKKNSLDEDLDICVYFEYSDDIMVVIRGACPQVTKRSNEYFDGSEGQDIVSGEYIKTYDSLDEYLEEQKK